MPIPSYIPLTDRRAQPADRIRLRARIGLAVLCVFGLALLLHASRDGAAGFLLLSLGVAGLGRDALRTSRDRRAARAGRDAEAARVQLKRERAARSVRERELRRQARLHAQQTRSRQTDTQRAQQDEQRRARRQQDAARADRAVRMERAAERLSALTADALRAEMASIFAGRGLIAVPGAEDADCDLRLMSPSGAPAAVARQVPVGKIAGEADVRALDLWRDEAGASHAYLVATAGFTPSAIRLAQSLPLTLVETHLLAAWQESDGRLDGEPHPQIC